MDWLVWYYFLISISFVTVIADTGHVKAIYGQQDERIRLECTVSSRLDAEEVCVEKYFIRSNAFMSIGGETTFLDTFIHTDYQCSNELVFFQSIFAHCFFFLGHVDAHSSTAQS